MAIEVTLKGEAMRLAEDLSNIHEFAFFVGGSISNNAGPNPVVAMADIKGGVTYIHAGDYAIVSADGEIQKWYSYDFEKSFGYIDGLEKSPIDTPYFFQVTQKSYNIKTIIDEATVQSLIWPVRNAATAKIFRNRAARKVEANPDHMAVSNHLPAATYAEFDKLYTWGTVVFSDGTAAVLAWGPEGSKERVLFTGIPAGEVEAVQRWLNREMLLKGHYFMMMLDY